MAAHSSAPPGYVLKHKRTTLERAEKFTSPDYFTDVNLYGRLYPKKEPLKSLQHFAAPDRIQYAEAEKGKYEETKVGTSFGPIWSTHWFKLEIEIPKSWIGEYVVLVWDSESEAMIWKNKQPIQGFSPENKRLEYTLSKKLTAKELKHTLWVEMACNDVFGTGNGLIQPPDPSKRFTLKVAEIRTKDIDAQSLLTDIETLHDMAKYLPEGSNRSFQALYAVNSMVNLIDHQDRTTYQRARQIAKNFYDEHNGQSQHTIYAMGHCHIDTAWLWPYAETIRKCARSWASTIRLMEEYPNLTFTCSQAQQFEWVKVHYPSLYKDIKKFVKQGRFVPVGGAWVEMDGNIPSGEAFIRQFLYGQKFFEKEFGSPCLEFWLPDTFGYTGNMPQLMRHCGIKRFVTQKLSWSLVNKFPHHTFWWAGIDGSEVLSHFPPGDTYTMKGKVKELLFTAENFKDKGRSNHSLYLFGHGDGGQGPTADMIERLNRIPDVDGLPKVQMSTPDEFFTQVEATEGDSLCRWSGELFLEFHNGTYTSQAKTKEGNRKSELLLRDVEMLATLAKIEGSGDYNYPADELDRLWKLLLLNQFHDVLPGTSIHMVYKDTLSHYKDIRKSGTNLLQESCKKLLQSKDSNPEVGVLVNTLGWKRSQVVASPTQEASPAKKKKKTNPLIQTDMNGVDLVFASVTEHGYSVSQPVEEVENPVSIEKRSDDSICIQNKHLKAVIDPVGRVTELYIQGSARNAIPEGSEANQLLIFDDVPLFWDAWDVMDYHLETEKKIEDVLEYAHIVDNGPLRATIKVMTKISDNSFVKQFISLDVDSKYLKFDTEVEWHENHKFLKVEFPVDVLATQATYEIQCGYLQRPTHFNTSWETAKYEVCGHKWADLSEYGFGVAVLNDSKYGWSCIGNRLRLSLLRSPKAPDEKADMGTQIFSYAMMPHNGTFQEAGVIQAAYEFNNPLQVQSIKMGTSVPKKKSFISVDQPSVILETVKKCQDHDDAIVLRFYEAFGAHATAKIKINFDIKNVKRCTGVEAILEDSVDVKDNVVTLAFKPFQIISLVCKI